MGQPDDSDASSRISCWSPLAPSLTPPRVGGVDPDGLALARRMAFRACDWAVFSTPDDYAKLRRAADCFRMHSLTLH
jgi:hypothetical protein